MKAFTKPILLAAAVALALAGCSTTPDEQSPAGVESRTPAPTKPGPTTGTPGQQGIRGTDLTGKPSGAGALAAVKQGVLARRSIYYDFDKFDVKDEYRGMVEAHAKFLRDNPNVRMLIQGNADDRGSREYNVGLGQRRSEGVKKMLVLLGAREGQVESVSLGEEKPQAEGQNEEAWSKNRRSDILYSGEF